MIGEGAVGSCCTLALLREGFAVTLLDPIGFGAGCANGTAGIFATSHIFPAATEGAVRQLLAAASRDSLESPVVDKAHLAALLPWFSAFAASAGSPRATAAGAVLRSLLLLAVPHFQMLLGKSASAAFMQRAGWLYVYETEEEFQRAGGERLARRQAGIPVEDLTGAELHSLEPDLPKHFRRAALLPDIVHVPDLDGLLKTIGRAALGEGAELRTVAADAITCLQDGNFIVLAGGARLSANLVVLAAGPHSAPLAAQLGLELPHSAERGYSVTLPQANMTLSRPVTFARERMVVAPMQGGLRLTSTAEFTDVRTPPDYRHSERQLAFARDLLVPFRFSWKRIRRF